MKKEHKYQAIFAAPFGMLGIVCEEEALTSIEFLSPDVMPLYPTQTCAQNVCKQLADYVSNPAFQFKLPLRFTGTAHQNKVWQAISAIPRGQTRQYGELARELSSSPRAIGQACGANPIPLVIPCHRVVSKNGIGGFAHQEDGYELGIKRWLLAHEQH